MIEKNRGERHASHASLSKSASVDDSYILIYSTRNEGKSIVAERFTRTLKCKIYKKNDSTFYLGYLNKLVDQNNNAYHNSVDKKPTDAGYSAFPEETDINTKATISEISGRVRLLSTRIFTQAAHKIGRKKSFLLILCCKLIEN